MDSTWVVHSDWTAHLCCHATPITFRDAACFSLSHRVAFGFHLNSVLLTVCGICYILCGDRRDVLGRAGDKIIQILLPVRLLPLTLCSWVT